MSISGTVLSGEGFGASAGYCRWRLVAGPGWTLVRGAAAGHSQTCGGGAAGDSLLWAAPLDAVLASRSLRGWPQLQVSVWSVDAHGRHALAGYGLARVPAAAGAHAVEVACWAPVAGAPWSRAAAVAFFLGAPPELDDAAAAADGRARHRLATATAGSVLVELGVLCRGFEAAGVELPGPGRAAAAGRAHAPL